MSKIKEWITIGIITSNRNRQKLYTKLKARPFNLHFKQYYICYQNILNLFIRKSKQLYYQNYNNRNQVQ